ncbi:MAG: NADH-quinone oxidoreductase subunit NuoH [Verrucomicrobiae bacterium]|nr:NADH-quinone oxidoreductase subunit NuoH [Verrucomicrobiae bacterium]
MNSLDQIFVQLKHRLVELAPPALQPLASMLINIAAIIAVFGLLFALVTVLERKGLGRIQNRRGPNRVGPAGFLQFAADGIKALIKEDIVPAGADRVLHFLAPFVLVAPVLLAYSVLPMGRNMVAIDLDAAVLFFFAAGAATELAPFLAGWASSNKYSLLGALRAIAQMLSYEIPLVLAAVPVLMMAGTLSTTQLVEAQAGYWGWIPNWHVFTPWGLAGFILFLIAATAESNRSPFDLPEGESELVAGYFVEYSGFKFALFFLGEYLGMFAVSGLAITLFLGGWHAPLPWLTGLPSWFWFFTKLLALIALFIWVRGTLPRLRMDQLMSFAWKFLLPLALVNLVVAGLCRFLPGEGWWGGLVQWVVGGGLLLAAWWGLGRGLSARRGWGKREYRYAE